jgi:tetratricopeptide (TPR) repeat protein
VSGRISVFSQTILSSSDGPHRFEARDWRLLVFLMWRTHLAMLQDDEPPAFRREQLQIPVAISDQRQMSSAVSSVRSMLRAVGCEKLLIDADGRVGLQGLSAVPCDLVTLLQAVAQADAQTAMGVLNGAFGLATVDHLQRRIQPKRPERRVDTAWLKEIDEYVAALVQGDAGLSDVEVDGDARIYLEDHRTRCSAIDPRRMGRSSKTQDIRLPLEDVYISLVLGPNHPAEVVADLEVTSDDAHLMVDREAVVEDRARDDLLALHESERRPSIGLTELICERRWAVVLGDPGAGKTTLLHWLALFHARALLEGKNRLVVDGEHLGAGPGPVDLGPTRLPILVRIADYAASAEENPGRPLPDLIDFLGSHPLVDEPLRLAPDAAAQTIHRWLDAGRALVLLDGLDEVTDPGLRAEIVGRVERFVRDHVKSTDGTSFLPWDGSTPEGWWRVRESEPAVTSGNQVIVTSRGHGYKQAALTSPFTLVKVQPLDVGSIERFCQRWALAVERFHAIGADSSDEDIIRRAGAESEALYAAVTSHRNVRRLAQNPLLLTVLAMLQRESESGHLPTRRLDLYQQATRVLVERRLLSWQFEEVIDVLGPFALWLHENRPSGYASIVELEAQLRIGISRVASRDFDKHIANFIAEAQAQAGLLVEVGAERFGFAHGTFREYLAAIELTRELDEFRAWLPVHMHEARWIEVVLLGVAAVAQRHPEEIDALLYAMLEDEPRLEAVLHHDLLVVADCLVETQRGTPRLVSDIILKLLDACADAEARGFAELNERITQTLGQLVERRPRVVTPVLTDALREPEIAMAATTVLAVADPSEELLDALDLACRAADCAPIAITARASVSARMLAAGAILRPELLSIGALFSPDSKHRSAFEALSRCAPSIAEVLQQSADSVDPALHRLVVWTLARIARGQLPESDSDEFVSVIVDRALDALTSARGADFSSLASFAFEVSPERAGDWLADRFAAGTVDPSSAARFYANRPEALPTLDDLPDWLLGLDTRSAAALLHTHNLGHRPLLTDLGWRLLGETGDQDAREAALTVLTSVSAALGYLPASIEALHALNSLLAKGSDDYLLGETLLARLRLRDYPLDSATVDPTPLLEEILETQDDPRRQAAAVMLASRARRPMSTAQYDLVADALANDEGLRPSVLAALIQTRPEDVVTEDVLRRAAHHLEERLASGDNSGANAHEAFMSRVLYRDGGRVLRAILNDDAWHLARLEVEACEDVLDEILGLPDEVAKRAIESCRARGRAHERLGLDLDRLETLCVSDLPESVRAGASELVSVEATLARDLARLEQFLTRLAPVDAEAAALALKTAAHCLPSAVSAAATPEQLASIGYACLPATAQATVAVSGALLAVDSLTSSQPSAVLDLLAERAATDGEMARAITYAVETDHDWPPAVAENQVVGRSGVVVRRVVVVAQAFSAMPRGMEALVQEASRRLSDDSWPSRRAAVLILDAVASAHPGQFLKAAKGTGLREALLAVARDRESFSVRRLVLSVLSQFRQLDQAVVDLIAAGCRDNWTLNSTILARCRTFGISRDLNLDSLGSLMASRNPLAVSAGAILLANVTASVPDGPGVRRHEAIEALAALVLSTDPMLDSAGTSAGRTLRQMLLALLGNLAWEATSQSQLTPGLGRAVVRGSFDSSELTSDPAGLLNHSQHIVDAVEPIGAQSWMTQPAKPLHSAAVDLSWGEFWREEQTKAHEHLFNLVVTQVLEARVGAVITSFMNSEQLNEFDRLYRNRDEAGALLWLTRTFPNYRALVEREALKLHSEISQSSAQLFRALDAHVVIEEPGEAARRALEHVAAELEDNSDEHTAAGDVVARRARQVHASARMLQRLERLEAAELLFQHVLDDLAALDETDTQFAFVVWHDLGRLSSQRGASTEAIERFELALEGNVRVQGRAHPDTLTCALDVVSEIAVEDLAAALERLAAEEKVIEDAGAPPGQLERIHDHRRGLRITAARRLAGDGQFGAAEQVAKEALDELAESGEGKTSMAYVLWHDLGDFAAARQDYKLALKRLRTALRGKQRTLSVGEPDTITTLIRFAQVLALDKFEAAGQMLATEASRLSKIDGSRHEIQRIRHARSLLLYERAGVLSERDEYAEAEELGRLALSELKAIGDDGPLCYAVHGGLAYVAAAQGKTAKAIAHREIVLAGLVRLRGAEHPETLEAVFMLVDEIARTDLDKAMERLTLEAEHQGEGDTKAILESHRPVTALAAGRQAERDELWEQAEIYYQRALDELRAQAGTDNELGDVLWRDLGDTAAARNELSLAVERYEHALNARDARAENQEFIVATVRQLLLAQAYLDLELALQRLETEVDRLRTAGVAEEMLEPLFGDRVRLVVEVADRLVQEEQPALAEAAYCESLNVLDRLGLADTTEAYALWCHYGDLAYVQGKLADAYERLRRAHVGQVALLGCADPETVTLLLAMFTVRMKIDSEAALSELAEEAGKLTKAPDSEEQVRRVMAYLSSSSTQPSRGSLELGD